MRVKKSIIRECIFCGEPIAIKAGQELPEGIEFIQTKKDRVLLVHTKCVDKMKRSK